MCQECVCVVADKLEGPCVRKLYKHWDSDYREIDEGSSLDFTCLRPVRHIIFLAHCRAQIAFERLEQPERLRGGETKIL